MNNSDTLPRVLVNAKLHRRVTVDAAHSRCANAVQESLKHRCPPIEAAKDKASGDHGTMTDNPQLGLSMTSLHEKPCQENLVGTNSPYSPVNSLSPACAVIASACSHDHDYVSADVARTRRDSGLLSRSASPSKADKLEDVANRPILELKTVRIPVPPSKTLQPTSPREAKQVRDVGSRLRRRCIKLLEETPKSRKGKSVQNEEVIDNSCIFVSTRRTAEPRKPRSRNNQQKKRREKTSEESLAKELKPSDKDPISSSCKRTDVEGDEGTACVASSAQQHFPANEFDVTKDKLTAEWQKLVKKYRPNKKDNECESEDSDFDEVCMPQHHSTPIRKERLSISSNLPSPRPSITPCPPSVSRKSDRSCKLSGNTNAVPDHELQASGTPEQDSAYFSIDSSLNSIRPSSSLGTPIFRSEGRGSSGSRPATGNRSAASTRPPSGGKRVAAASLSSTSSSSTSSDDDSICSSLSSHKPEGSNTNTRESKEGKGRRNRTPSADNISKSPSDNFHQDHEAIKARKGKKFVRQIDGAKKATAQPHIHPVPPRKPKKDPLPMHLRALPTSFFQEPNRVSPSPYNILPPVQPLFRQVTTDDVADIRPVTPPENRLKEGNPPAFNDGQRVIITGDTEMLQRLFDAVEPQHQPTGRRVKRGRPKRTPRIMPSPKLTLDDNPCIMQSITDSLFPNLSIDKRNNKTTSVRNPVSTLAVERNREETNFNSNNNNFSDGEMCSKDLAQFGFISLASGLYDDDIADVPMEIASPIVTSQHQEVLALPQLPASQDFSQMLTKVAACL